MTTETVVVTSEETPTQGAPSASIETAETVAEAAVEIAQIEADRDVAIAEVHAEAATEQTEAIAEAQVETAEAHAAAAEAVVTENEQWRTELTNQVATLAADVSSLRETLISASQNQPESSASPEATPDSHAAPIAEPAAAEAPPEPAKKKQKHRWI